MDPIFSLACRYLLAVLVMLLGWPSLTVYAQSESAPAMLQMFEAEWDTIEDRMVDLFYVGYGQLWVPPPSRADSGNHSVGYDVYDRFDLGSAGNTTLYGTEHMLMRHVQWMVQVIDLLGLGNGSFEQALYSQNTVFHAAADVDGNGLVDNRDLFLLGNELILSGAEQSILDPTMIFNHSAASPEDLS